MASPWVAPALGAAVVHADAPQYRIFWHGACRERCRCGPLFCQGSLLHPPQFLLLRANLPDQRIEPGQLRGDRQLLLQAIQAQLQVISSPRNCSRVRSSGAICAPLALVVCALIQRLCGYTSPMNCLSSSDSSVLLHGTAAAGSVSSSLGTG